MFETQNYPSDLDEAYSVLLSQVESLLSDPTYTQTGRLANASALLNFFFDNINWVGFYLLNDEEDTLQLSCFQGLPACISIPLGKGVCGCSALEKKTIVVDDVHTFPGHIACDARSLSEIVVPLFNKNNRLVGVLDIDSPIKSRFSDKDKLYIEKLAKAIAHYVFD